MCRKCGKPVLTAEVYRTTVCADCGADLHSCINCKYYAPGSHYDCHATVDELVSYKERANFCHSFSLNKDFSASTSNASKEQKARDAFASLFGN